MEITQVFGIVGAVTYLGSYFLLQLGRIDGNGNYYAFFNMVAAMFVLISLTTHFNIGAMIIQVSFLALSIYAIFRSHWSRRDVALAPTEQQLLDVLFPNLPARRVLPLIRKGKWHNETSGALAIQGQPIRRLSVLLSGEAKVSKSGKPVGSIGAGQIVGEVSWHNNDLATADVSIKEQAHYFSISAVQLRRFLSKNTDAARAFDAGLRNQLVQKLA
jgi:CRP-like cAMP-binding protein